MLVDGACVLYVERGGRTLLSFTDDPAVLQPAADALALAVRDGALGRLQVERADGVPVERVARSATRWRPPGSGPPRAACGCAADVPGRSADARGRHRLAHRAPAGPGAGRAAADRWPTCACRQLATADLRGRTVTEVLARGKHILTRLDDDLTLHSHLRMDGSWYLSRTGERTPRRHPEHLIRVLLGNDDWRATGYRVHDLRLVRPPTSTQLVGHLGPDLLGPGLGSRRGAVANLRGRPGRRRSARRCSTSATSPASATCTSARCCSSSGSTRGRRSRSCPTCRRLVDTAQRLLRANRDHPEQSTTG